MRYISKKVGGDTQNPDGYHGFFYSVLYTKIGANAIELITIENPAGTEMDQFYS